MFSETKKIMKAENEKTGTANVRLNASPAPSMRVPVTTGNRTLLRWLRAAESSAWDAPRQRLAGGCASGSECSPANPVPPESHPI